MTCHPAEVRSRARKATLLAGKLLELGYTTESAELFPDRAREIVARLAGVKPPSATTWAAAIGVLDALEHARPVVSPNVEALVG